MTYNIRDNNNIEELFRLIRGLSNTIGYEPGAGAAPGGFDGGSGWKPGSGGGTVTTPAESVYIPVPVPEGGSFTATDIFEYIKLGDIDLLKIPGFDCTQVFMNFEQDMLDKMTDPDFDPSTFTPTPPKLPQMKMTEKLRPLRIKLKPEFQGRNNIMVMFAESSIGGSDVDRYNYQDFYNGELWLDRDFPSAQNPVMTIQYSESLGSVNNGEPTEMPKDLLIYGYEPYFEYPGKGTIQFGIVKNVINDFQATVAFIDAKNIDECNEYMTNTLPVEMIDTKEFPLPINVLGNYKVQHNDIVLIQNKIIMGMVGMIPSGGILT